MELQQVLQNKSVIWVCQYLRYLISDNDIKDIVFSEEEYSHSLPHILISKRDLPVFYAGLRFLSAYGLIQKIESDFELYRMSDFLFELIQGEEYYVEFDSDGDIQERDIDSELGFQWINPKGFLEFNIGEPKIFESRQVVGPESFQSPLQFGTIKSRQMPIVDMIGITNDIEIGRLKIKQTKPRHKWYVSGFLLFGLIILILLLNYFLNN